MITRPMLSATIEDIGKLTFPLLATPKIDGIRCLVVNGKAVSRTFKPIQNHYIRQTLAQHAIFGLNNVDGELIVGDNFQTTSSGVMSYEGRPDYKYIVFDSFEDPEKPYESRVSYFAGLPPPRHCQWLPPTEVVGPTVLQDLLDYYLEQGYEGIMLRRPGSPYKCGRSTLKEGYLMKLKPFADREAIVIDFAERMHNSNPEISDNFGLAKHSHRQDGMIPEDTLGSLYVSDSLFGNFFIGSGFTDRERKDIWMNREKYLGKMVTYKYQKHGMKDKPRCPVFKCWRVDV